MQRMLFILLPLFFLLLTFSFNAQAKRGCCSHHGGVAYCDGNTGQYVCRDGSYSPSCGCSKSNGQRQKRKNSQSSY